MCLGEKAEVTDVASELGLALLPWVLVFCLVIAVRAGCRGVLLGGACSDAYTTVNDAGSEAIATKC